jgi:hypothetical protein
MALDPRGRSIGDGVPSLEVEMPLVDGSEGLIGLTRIQIARVSSGWQISAPDGFGDEARLICGGTVLEARDSVAIFTAGGFSIVRRGSSM